MARMYQYQHEAKQFTYGYPQQQFEHQKNTRRFTYGCTQQRFAYNENSFQAEPYTRTWTSQALMDYAHREIGNIDHHSDDEREDLHSKLDRIFCRTNGMGYLTIYLDKYNNPLELQREIPEIQDTTVLTLYNGNPAYFLKVRSNNELDTGIAVIQPLTLEDILLFDEQSQARQNSSRFSSHHARYSQNPQYAFNRADTPQYPINGKPIVPPPERSPFLARPFLPASHHSRRSGLRLQSPINQARPMSRHSAMPPFNASRFYKGTNGPTQTHSAPESTAHLGTAPGLCTSKQVSKTQDIFQKPPTDLGAEPGAEQNPIDLTSEDDDVKSTGAEQNPIDLTGEDDEDDETVVDKSVVGKEQGDDDVKSTGAETAELYEEGRHDGGPGGHGSASSTRFASAGAGAGADCYQANFQDYEGHDDDFNLGDYARRYDAGQIPYQDGEPDHPDWIPPTSPDYGPSDDEYVQTQPSGAYPDFLNQSANTSDDDVLPGHECPIESTERPGVHFDPSPAYGPPKGRNYNPVSDSSASGFPSSPSSSRPKKKAVSPRFYSTYQRSGSSPAPERATEWPYSTGVPQPSHKRKASAAEAPQKKQRVSYSPEDDLPSVPPRRAAPYENNFYNGYYDSYAPKTHFFNDEVNGRYRRAYAHQYARKGDANPKPKPAPKQQRRPSWARSHGAAILGGKLTHYEVLRVGQKATPKEIMKAFRTVSLLYHPDKDRDDPTANEKMKAIILAKEVLMDVYQRAEYNSILRVHGHG